MDTGIDRVAVRLLSILTLVLFVALGFGTAEAEPDADKPTQSEHANKPDSPPGQSGQDLSKPQPPSNADYTGNGANTHGPYDSTRDGSASQNGNGDGQAVGKPCAGCVGKADNKNPPGQQPGGSDPNAGYECDRNSGIGKTNPAHTGCTENPPTTTPPATPTPPTPTPPGDNPPGISPGVNPGVNPPAGGSQTSSEELALTGTDVGSLLQTALVLLGVGGLLLFATRRAAARRG